MTLLICGALDGPLLEYQVILIVTQVLSNT